MIKKIKNHFNSYYFPYELFPIIGLGIIAGVLIFQIVEEAKVIF